MTEPFDDNSAGYGRPPVATRFKKGQSGNSKGRPKGRHKQPPYECILGQRVVIRKEGIKREVTAAEAFLLHITKRGLEGDGAAARTAMAAIEAAHATRVENSQRKHIQTTIRYVRPGSINAALEPLRMGKRLDRYRRTARIVLEAWIIEAALARLGDRRLTPEEQTVVVRAARKPKNVRWPDWWVVMPD